jgi:hypothetical protein
MYIHMNKLHINICVDFDIVKAHRQLGTNISQLCNDALTSYLAQQGADIKKQAEVQMNLTNRIVETSQAKAAVESQTKELIEEARQAGTQGKEYNSFLQKAKRISGLSMGEIVARLQRL